MKPVLYVLALFMGLSITFGSAYAQDGNAKTQKKPKAQKEEKGQKEGKGKGNGGDKAQGPKKATLTIQSSVQCGMCKKTINQALAKQKGAKIKALDLTKSTITVEYNTKNTTPEAIKKAIASVGYDADEVKADPAAYGKLPACCKKTSK